MYMILLITSVVLLFYYYKHNSIPHPTTSTVLNKVAGLIEEPSDTGLGNIADKEENNVAKEDFVVGHMQWWIVLQRRRCDDCESSCD